MTRWFKKHEEAIVNHGSSALIGLFGGLLAWVALVMVGAFGIAFIFGIYVYHRSLMPSRHDVELTDA